MTDTADAPEPRLPVPGWCLLQRRDRMLLGGYVQEVEIAGAPYLELKVPDGNGGWQFSRFFNAATDISSIIPSDEKSATAKALKQWRPTP